MYKQLRELIVSEGVTYASGPSRPFVPPGFTYYRAGKRCNHPECNGKWTALKDGMCLRHAEVLPPNPPGRPRLRQPNN